MTHCPASEIPGRLPSRMDVDEAGSPPRDSCKALDCSPRLAPDVCAGVSMGRCEHAQVLVAAISPSRFPEALDELPLPPFLQPLDLTGKG
ncbi:Ankyrin repeat domain-containing protein 9 [Fukomys damarensis]|uniref:Ankyrin repeat domain-containing protein 9 n=1 Tax=Fukomys damarensis TaxID=885580 RepID=A0A091CWS2_FUKDA|nr:Ankyrin repeat domain-containing protein 9 [Fukomys damarensis]